MARLLILVLVAVACGTTSLLDLSNTLNAGEFAVWLTSGVGVAAAMSLGASALPAVAAGGFVAFAILAGPDWSTQAAHALLLRGIGFGLAQAAEVALCAALLKRWVGPSAEPRRPLDGLRWLFAVAVSAWLGSILVALALFGAGDISTAPFVVWSLSRVAGVLLIAPLVLAWVDAGRRTPGKGRPVERLALHLLAIGMLLAVFDLLQSSPDSPLLAALVLVFPLVAAWRLGERDASVIAVYTIAIALWATDQGIGPLGSYGSVLSIPLLSVIVTIPSLTALGLLGPAEAIKAKRFRHDEGTVDRSVEPKLGQPLAAVASDDGYRDVFEAQPVMMFTLHDNGRILHANRFAAEQLGYQPTELLGRRLHDLHLEGQRDLELSKLEECVGHSERVFHWQGCVLRKDGSPLWVRQSARSTIDPRFGRVVLLVCEDVSEARVLSKQLSHEARHDALTGLVNRRELENGLRRLLGCDDDVSAEHALLYVDLDQLRVIVEACGHGAGDALLRNVAQHLSGAVRRGDVLARLGEDEFGILLEGCGLEHAMRVARAARTSIADLRFVWDNRTFLVGVSIGVVPLSGQKGDASEVMRHAEEASHAAKEEGRNRIHVYRHDDRHPGRRQWERRWASGITNALEEGRFHLCYQSIVPLAPDALRGRNYELLLRMRDNNGRVVPPSAFLPAAERYGLATRLDRWVLRNALGWLQQRPRERILGASFAINLSGQSLADPDFLRFAESHIRSSGIVGAHICFEITETAAIGDTGAVMAFMHGLKALGCRFALDNFGIGLSSLGYLKSLPVDVVKIDGTFVEGMADNALDRATVESISQLGRVLGMQTVAEWVEDQSMLDRIRRAGVEFAQGYCFGRPEPLDLFDSRGGGTGTGNGLVVG